MDRRTFLKGLGLAAFAPSSLILTPSPALAGPQEDFWQRDRSLWLKRNIGKSTQEIQATYWRDGKLDVEGYVRICHILRDVRANETVRMNVDLLNILFAQQGWLAEWGYRQPIIINSGYRNRKTNAAIEGAARDSEHTRGNAVDMVIPGVPTAYLGKLNRYMTDGGVGIYMKKKFVHVDTGRFRSWTG
jgi:uncharacterized protein YcbK (DUF882 family)